MEANFNGVKRLIFKGREYEKIYAGNIKIWSKPISFVAKPLPRGQTPDKNIGGTTQWTITGVRPNRTYQVQITGVQNGVLKASQEKLGDSELALAGASGGTVFTSITFTNPEGILYITMSNVFTGNPELTIS
ncbi:hypothetical protein [Staphylococcus chromogenes]|uniref:hypothetical protein n=1 Tax=Staphylococcus chromogenes TaxID=46126 RepID=UPI002885B6CD|nr:hypothetical protein [Staphylococcus chromogenes]MDT0700451.1 hypothetical protein [Staphylococcus chromogenes]